MARRDTFALKMVTIEINLGKIHFLAKMLF